MCKPRIIGLYVLIATLFFSCKDNAQAPQGEHKYTNDLINETSPYLLQHAHNPVNWRPWSEEALEDAKKENKLVLVSIGYSSCHWCHVMEEETFEDEGIAKIMNENFINIKVDREERPDVDHVYMTALQLIKGNGGWPLNMIVLPNGKPLYGGTYHTKEQWSQVLTKISELYNGDPKKAAEYADMVAAGIAEANMITPTDDLESLNTNTLQESLDRWRENWDLKWGGDQGTQKFMIPSNLDFLLDYAELASDESVESHAINTLNNMVRGGIYDHVGGGFFRYSTDPQWKVPHFEKMLYDNAQLLSLYAKAHTMTQREVYEEVVAETVEFLDREMKNPEGGYYAAIDADSEGEEGKFYIWKKEELTSIIKTDFELFADYYTIDDGTVWEEGNYVLHKLEDDGAFAKGHSISPADLQGLKKQWKDELLNARGKRVRPNIDDKIITSWNALLINGFVDAYNAFGKSQYLDRAQDIFEFLNKNCVKNGQLVHSYKKGARLVDGFLEDYAYLADASLGLYGATMNHKYLEFAQDLNQKALDQFGDEASGMFRYNQNEELIAKIVKTDDGVLPSPNAVMAHNLFQLGHIEYNRDFLDKSKSMLSSMVPAYIENGQNYARWGALLLNVAFPYFEIAVVGDNAQALLQDIETKHLPNTLVIGSANESELPLFKGRYVEGDTYIYVCQDATCKLPVETVGEALNQMENF